jgi:hypothetical protein
MSSKYVEFPIEGGGRIVLESPDDPEQPGAGFRRAGAGDPSTWSNKAQKTFDQSVANVRHSAGILLNSLSELSPDEIEVHFNLKVTGELGGELAIAKAGGEANYHVTLRWQKPKKEEKKEEKKDEEGRKE